MASVLLIGILFLGVADTAQTAVLEKPFAPATLVAAIQRALGRTS